MMALYDIVNNNVQKYASKTMDVAGKSMKYVGKKAGKAAAYTLLGGLTVAASLGYMTKGADASTIDVMAQNYFQPDGTNVTEILVDNVSGPDPIDWINNIFFDFGYNDGITDFQLLDVAGWDANIGADETYFTRNTGTPFKPADDPFFFVAISDHQNIGYSGVFATNDLGDDSNTVNIEGPQANMVPIPQTMLLLGSGLIGLVGIRRKKSLLAAFKKR